MPSNKKINYSGGHRKILVVEDDAVLNRLICKSLNKRGFCAEGVFTGAEAVAMALTDPEMMLVLDYGLPDMTGKEVIMELERKECLLPFIMMTGEGDEKLAVEMMKIGARDYIVKETSLVDILPHIVEKVNNDLQLERELLEAEKTIRDRQRDLTVLFRVSSAISQTIDIKRLFDIILETILNIEFLKVEQKAGIFLIEDDRMELVAWTGHTEAFVDLHKSMRIGECLCGHAARTGEIITSGNSNEDIRHTIRYPEMQPHGHVILPLKARNRVIGVLYLYIPVDYIIDEGTHNLLYSLGSQIGIAIDNARLYEEAKKYALHDPLTGLANRRMMHIVFERSFNMAKRTGDPFSIIMLDIDHFKNFNDTHGHSAGDRLLVELSKLLIKETRKVDLVVRYGGEEFLILLSETNLERACDVAERMRMGVESTLDTTISLGIASLDPSIHSEEDFIKKADEALYKAKKQGRNMVVVYK